MDGHMAPDEGMRSSTDDVLQVPLFAPHPSHFERWAEVLDRRPDLQPEFFGLDHGVADQMDRSDAAGNGCGQSGCSVSVANCQKCPT